MDKPPTPAAALIQADLDGLHGHLEPDFDPEPQCAGPLADIFTVQAVYTFTD